MQESGNRGLRHKQLAHINGSALVSSNATNSHRKGSTNLLAHTGSPTTTNRLHQPTPYLAQRREGRLADSAAGGVVVDQQHLAGRQLLQGFVKPGLAVQLVPHLLLFCDVCGVVCRASREERVW